MIANGDPRSCVGIESGPATGWPFTDWVEELVLREQGIDYYNQWGRPRGARSTTSRSWMRSTRSPGPMAWGRRRRCLSGGSIAATAFG